MKTQKPNAELVWKQLEDLLVPRLRLGVIDRAVYSHLFRHSRLEGKLQIRFSIRRMARGIHISESATRPAVRRLIDQKALRLVECNTAGHVAEVRLPEEILADLPPEAVSAEHPEDIRQRRGAAVLSVNLEDKDFLRFKALRRAIHAREAGRCFYCLRLTFPQMRCIDHVVPRAQSGNNSYRNLVSCCRECNAQKGPCRADDYFRSLFRDCKLTDRELAGRLRALDALASGKLPPPLPSDPIPTRGSPVVSGRRALGRSRT